MIDRQSLGQTGMEVSEIGLGTWPLAVPGKGLNYGGTPDAHATAVLDAYIEGGGNFLDTALVYNQVEQILGKYLKQRGNRDQLIISSKTPGGQTAETLSQIDEDIETTLKDLGTDYVDVYFLHQPPEDPDVMEQAIEKMRALKRAGKIRAIGASVKGPDVTAKTQTLCDAYIATGHVDVLQVVYNILRQRNLSAIEKAAKNGVGIVVRTVLESGILTGAYAPGHTFSDVDHRSRYDQQKLDFALQTVEEIGTFALRPPYTKLSQVAIRFSLSALGISCIILGAQSPEEVRMNLSTLDLPPLPSDLVAELRARYGGITEQANFS